MRVLAPPARTAPAKGCTATRRPYPHPSDRKLTDLVGFRLRCLAMRRLPIVAAVLAAACFLAACGDDSSSSSTTAGAATTGAGSSGAATTAAAGSRTTLETDTAAPAEACPPKMVVQPNWSP